MRKLRFALILVVAITFLLTAPSNSNSCMAQERLVEIGAQEYQRSMQVMANDFLYLFDNMPSHRVLIKERREFTHPAQGRQVLALFDSHYEGKPTILINPDYVGRASYIGMVDSLLHELTHAWVYWKRIGDNVAEGHGEPFLRKAIEIGLKVDSILFIYPETRPIHARLVHEYQARRSGGQNNDESSRNRSPEIPSWARGTDNGSFGPDIYQFRYFPLGSTTGEIILVKVQRPVTVGTVYRWKGKRWQVTRVSGAEIDLKELLPDWVATRSMPASLSAKLTEMSRNETLRSVAITPNGGWVVIGSRTFSSYNIPNDLNNKINEVFRGGEFIQSVGVMPNGGWIVVGNKRFHSNNLPDALYNKLVEMSKTTGEFIKSVVITPNGDWVIIGNKTYLTNNSLSEVFMKMLKVTRDGRSVESAVLMPDGSWQIVTTN